VGLLDKKHRKNLQDVGVNKTQNRKTKQIFEKRKTMSKTQNIKAFEQLGEYYDKYRTPEFIEAACEEHTSFTPDEFEDNKNLLALPIGDVEFDYTNMTAQPRGQNLNHDTVTRYAEQAKNGVSTKGKRLYGIRKPIVVISPEIHKTSFVGICGHHRWKAAIAAECKYIVAELDTEYRSLPKHEQTSRMMKDNAHPENGMPSSDDDIKDNLKTYIRNHPVAKKLIAIGVKLDNPATPAADRSRLKSEERRLKALLTEQALPSLQAWTGGRWNEKRAKQNITRALSDLNVVHVKTKIHTYEEEALKEIAENHKKSLGAHHLVKWINIKYESAYRQPLTEIDKDLADHYNKYHFDADEYDVLIAIKDAGTLKKLFDMRKKLADKLIYITDYLNVDKSKPVKYNLLFVGQCLAEGIKEEIGTPYTVREISDRERILNET